MTISSAYSSMNKYEKATLKYICICQQILYSNNNNINRRLKNLQHTKSESGFIENSNRISVLFDVREEREHLQISILLKKKV